ncbi:MAG: FAD-binding oxidoreductase [Chitinophagales bacterium]|nr:FAD-binding oxidoreductase [Chitinophagales bacterium]
MLSFWERESLVTYDVIVVGSGIVGLTTALLYKELHPRKSVLVIERGILPSGASTKNAGFACIGSISELEADLKSESLDAVLEVVEMRKIGLELLKKRVANSNVGFQNEDSYELLFDKDIRLVERIAFWNTHLSPMFKTDVFEMAFEQLPVFGFGDRVKGLIRNNVEGAMDTGKMMRYLTDVALKAGVEIKTGAEVIAVQEFSTFNKIFIFDRSLNTNIEFRSDLLFVCSNGFTKQLFKDIDIRPGRGQVLITQPISQLKIKGIFHFDEGYYYFRNVGDRILFGGGRNKYKEKEETTEIGINNAIIQDLKAHLNSTVLPGTSFKIDMEWAGIMAFGEEKKPIIRQYSDRIFIGVRLGGMGVAIGSLVAKKLVELSESD